MIPLTDADHAAAALATMRRIARRSRRDVAAQACMHETQYGTYETGRRTPNLATMIRLADALGCDLALIPRADS